MKSLKIGDQVRILPGFADEGVVVTVMEVWDHYGEIVAESGAHYCMHAVKLVTGASEQDQIKRLRAALERTLDFSPHEPCACGEPKCVKLSEIWAEARAALEETK